jgi:hypothetical protein
MTNIFKSESLRYEYSYETTHRCVAQPERVNTVSLVCRPVSIIEQSDISSRCSVTSAASPPVLSDAFGSKMYGVDITHGTQCHGIMDPACPHDCS